MGPVVGFDDFAVGEHDLEAFDIITDEAVASSKEGIATCSECKPVIPSEESIY